MSAMTADDVLLEVDSLSVEYASPGAVPVTAVEDVSFTLRRSDLLFVGRDLRPTVEPGRFQIWIAPSAQAEGVSGAFTLA